MSAGLTRSAKVEKIDFLTATEAVGDGSQLNLSYVATQEHRRWRWMSRPQGRCLFCTVLGGIHDANFSVSPDLESRNRFSCNWHETFATAALRP